MSSRSTARTRKPKYQIVDALTFATLERTLEGNYVDVRLAKNNIATGFKYPTLNTVYLMSGCITAYLECLNETGS